MRILVVGATGTIGAAVARALSPEHEIVGVHRGSTPPVDIVQPSSIKAMFQAIGQVDAIVSAAGDAAFRPLRELSDADFQLSLTSKLMGQVNLVRVGLDYLRDHGSITLTSGVLSSHPMPGSAAVSLVNAALEAFGRAAALEAPRHIRVNVVSPPWVTDTLARLGMDTSIGLTPEQVAALYVKSVTGAQTGEVIEAKK